MRRFTSWDEAKEAYGWIGSEPMARKVKYLFERRPMIDHTYAVDDWVLFEGRTWLVVYVEGDFVIITDSDGEEHQVHVDRLCSLQKGSDR